MFDLVAEGCRGWGLLVIRWALFCGLCWLVFGGVVWFGFTSVV